jgi:hypothetical protein
MALRPKLSQFPYLRFLCYLLFKCSSLPFVSPVDRGFSVPRRRAYRYIRVKTKSLSNSVPSFSLLPSVQCSPLPFVSPVDRGFSVRRRRAYRYIRVKTKSLSISVPSFSLLPSVQCSSLPFVSPVDRGLHEPEGLEHRIVGAGSIGSLSTLQSVNR